MLLELDDKYMLSQGKNPLHVMRNFYLSNHKNCNHAPNYLIAVRAH